MNKETSKLYDELFDNWINVFIPDKGDNRIEVEDALHKLIKSIREDCAKIAENHNFYSVVHPDLAIIAKAIRED